MYSAIWLPRRYMITWLNVWRGDLLLRLPLHNPQGNWSTLCRMHGCMAAWQHAFHSTFNMIEEGNDKKSIEYWIYNIHTALFYLPSDHKKCTKWIPFSKSKAVYMSGLNGYLPTLFLHVHWSSSPVIMRGETCDLLV